MSTTVKNNSKSVNSTKVQNNTKLLSNEKLGMLLYSKNVTFEEAVKQFTNYYKQKQNVTDKQFIKLRTKIYLRIAEKRSKLQHKLNIKKVLFESNVN